MEICSVGCRLHSKTVKLNSQYYTVYDRAATSNSEWLYEEQVGTFMENLYLSWFIDFNKAYDIFMREVLYSIVTEFDMQN
jgi:hypothetical protein